MAKRGEVRQPLHRRLGLLAIARGPDLRPLQPAELAAANDQDRSRPYKDLADATAEPSLPDLWKLLRAAGYQTPYVGKWHASIPTSDPSRLQVYGFNGLTYPDPDGANLQGTVGDHSSDPIYLNDQDISNQAVQYLSGRRTGDDPWCLTVGFVNPHDQQFFWAGTEFQTYNDMFAAAAPTKPILTYSTTPPIVPWDADPLKSPPPLGYPALPPNWESAASIKAKKPSLQYFARTFSDAIWGGVSDDTSQSGFTFQPYPNPNNVEKLLDTAIGVAPFRYWQRCLDSYTNVMSIVDQRIGEVLGALPKDVAQNTIIVFGSDHGEYAGAHGFVAGKVGSCYEEPFHIPLIVVDPSSRFVGDIDNRADGADILSGHARHAGQSRVQWQSRLDDRPARQDLWWTPRHGADAPVRVRAGPALRPAGDG